MLDLDFSRNQQIVNSLYIIYRFENRNIKKRKKQRRLKREDLQLNIKC